MLPFDASSDQTALADDHDILLLDLDGTVYRGKQPTAGAAEALLAANARTIFLTNNASRRPSDVAIQLQSMGVAATAADIVTSAQSAARLLVAQLSPDDRVLIVGTDALADEINKVGLRPVRHCTEAPVAVVQGHSPTTGWQDLAEAALAIRGGALWVATNLDATFPTDRGLVPGNGSMVAALRTATEAQPQVAGKPGRAMIEAAIARGSFQAPLVIGDRLDTDIAGANAAGLPSLLVLSGVSTPLDVLHAPPAARPTYLAHNLEALAKPSTSLRIANDPAWDINLDHDTATISATDHQLPIDAVSVVRAIAATVWQHHTAPPRQLIAGDPAARAALQEAGLPVG
ncbi:HAD-IIA family hydrolase [Mycobacterium lehmannii]|uniref:HAD-IIA family hydrolase n=1 Tax=Mycobacterium lehmannii TaxID=2048550 RepID=UPI000B93BC72|nr:HAD-IIA family hydrolase [Mycobacterium lehmannii]